MADYLLILLEDEDAHATQSPTAMAGLIERRGLFADALRRTGRLHDHARLRPSKEGVRVRREGEELQTRLGPFGEEGRALAGYYWVKAASLEEAAELASGCPLLATDQIDVRPLMKGVTVPDKEAKPGKFFACVVLGSAMTEEGWLKVMDRIDAETAGTHHASFLGGVRLREPSSGRRVAAEGAAVLDGPFLESKEVIGGLFFLRMANLDEAGCWAGQTRFVVHGALEIREVWRS